MADAIWNQLIQYPLQNDFDIFQEFSSNSEDLSIDVDDYFVDLAENQDQQEVQIDPILEMMSAQETTSSSEIQYSLMDQLIDSINDNGIETEQQVSEQFLDPYFSNQEYPTDLMRTTQELDSYIEGPVHQMDQFEQLSKSDHLVRAGQLELSEQLNHSEQLHHFHQCEHSNLDALSEQDLQDQELFMALGGDFTTDNSSLRSPSTGTSEPSHASKKLSTPPTHRVTKPCKKRDTPLLQNLHGLDTLRVPNGYDRIEKLETNFNKYSYQISPKASTNGYEPIILRRDLANPKAGPSGLCPYCEEPKFLLINTSAYLHHLTVNHGVFSNGDLIPEPGIGVENCLMNSGRVEEIEHFYCPYKCDLRLIRMKKMNIKRPNDNRYRVYLRHVKDCHGCGKRDNQVRRKS